MTKRTPEGKVKDKVKSILDKFGTRIFYDMPVPGGYGKSTLDFIGCAGGFYFAIETKADDKKLTDRQLKTKKDMNAAHGKVFEIIGTDDPDLYKLQEWLTWKVGPIDEPDAAGRRLS